MIYGYGIRMERYRGGPLNIAGVAGLAKAAEIACDALSFEMEETRELRDRLEDGLRKFPGVSILVPWALRSPNTVLAVFENIESESLLYELNRKGIAAYSATVHPYGNWHKRSLVETLGLDPSLRHSTVGFALNRMNTEEEIDYTLDTLSKTLEFLRTLSIGMPIDQEERR
jgi:cysteine desulfurase